MLKKLNTKGFTLIELMIVIAIIGILAAIAVPQFNAYRLRSFNASGKSVCHNLKSDQANLYSETSSYGNVDVINLQTEAPALGATATVNTNSETSGAIPATSGQVGGALGNGRLTVAVVLGKDMNATTFVNTNGQSHCTYTRHFKGDTAYGMDSDVESLLYTVSNPTWVKAAGLGADINEESTSNVDNIANASGGGAPADSWSSVN